MKRLVRSVVAILAFLAPVAAAFGQGAVLQGGPWAPGRAPMYVGQGGQAIVQDSGPASGGAIGLGLAEQLLVARSPTNTYPVAGGGSGPLGTNWCSYDAPITNATGYHYFCISPNAQGGGLMAYGAAGGATPQNFSFNINGTPFQLPFVLSGIVGPSTTVTGNVMLWGNTVGTVATDGGYVPMRPSLNLSDVANPTTARSNLGLGTMSIQSSGAVAITGGTITGTGIVGGTISGTPTVSSGTITGIPNPSLAGDAANKSYVDSVATGLRVLAPSTLATAAVLPNTPTYANGASGVGATLTAGSNTTLTVDGTAAPLSTVVLVKNQASAFQNGVYTVTQAGSGAAPWILTRATYFDQAAEMTAGSYTFVTSGATLGGTSYTLQTTVATVGTDPVNWVLFASSSALTPGAGLVSSITAACSQAVLSGSATISSAHCINVQAGTTYAILDSDRAKVVLATNSLAIGFTIAQAGAASAFQSGWYVDIQNASATAAGIVTITATGSTICVLGACASTLQVQPGRVARLISDGTNYQVAYYQSSGQMPGDNTGNPANAGNIGELLFAEVTFAGRVAMTNASIPNSVLQSLNVTKGDWDCSGNHGFETTGGGAASEYHIEISTTGNSSLVTAPNKGGTQGTHLPYAINQGQVFPNGPVQILATVNPTSIFQKSYSTFTGSQTMYGYVRCRRMR